MSKGKNLFVKADELDDVAPVSSEVTDVINKAEQKGKIMKKSNVIFAENPKDKADTLYKLNKRIKAKTKHLDNMTDAIGAELFKFEMQEKAGIDLSGTVVVIPTLIWDSETKTESVVNKEWNSMERKLFLEKCIQSISAETTRLSFAQKDIAKAAVEPEATGEELYYLKFAVVPNDEKDTGYPSQEFKAIDNSLSLLKSVAFEIRNVILERKQADLYTKKSAGYFQRDARDLRLVVNDNKKKLKKSVWKLGYFLGR